MRNSISQLLRELRPQLNSRRSERRAAGGGGACRVCSSSEVTGRKKGNAAGQRSREAAGHLPCGLGCERVLVLCCRVGLCSPPCLGSSDGVEDKKLKDQEEKYTGLFEDCRRGSSWLLHAWKCKCTELEAEVSARFKYVLTHGNIGALIVPYATLGVSDFNYSKNWAPRPYSNY